MDKHFQALVNYDDPENRLSHGAVEDDLDAEMDAIMQRMNCLLEMISSLSLTLQCSCRI